MLELRPRHSGREAEPVHQRAHLDHGLRRVRKRASRRVALGLEAAEGRAVVADGLANARAALRHAQIEESVREVNIPEVPVTRGGLHLEDTILDLNLGRAECALTHLADEAGLGVFDLRAKAATGAGGRSRAIHNPKSVKSRIGPE